MSDRTRELECVIADLKQQVRDAEKERDALRAKIEAMEKQVPISRAEDLRHAEILLPSLGLMPEDKLYALPGAQAHPAPSVPDAWKLVPIEPTEAMVTAFAELFNVRDQKNTFGPAFRAALAAAPEAKP